MKLWTRPTAVRFALFTLGLALCAPALAQPSRDSWTARTGPRASAVATDRGVSASGAGPVALLVRNADTAGGAPPYALLDQYGQVQRYVEPSPGFNLSRYVGTQVRIRHDTGQTLLASQLELPDEVLPLRGPSRDGGGVVPADFAPPRRLERLANPYAPPAASQRYAVVPAQLNEDSAAPIVLEDLLAEEAANADSLPAPADADESDRLDPIADEYDDYEPIEREYFNDHPIEPSYRDRPHHADCPHCAAQRSTVTSNAAPSPCNCSKCRAKRGSDTCTTCGRGQEWCGPSCKPASRRGLYGRAEYLLWWFDEMNTPPLVTSGTVASQGVLGQPGTGVRYGGDLLDDARNGLRFTVGAWLDDQRDFGIEGDLLFFETEGDFFAAGDPTGASVIGRPFYNLNNLAEDAQLVSFPNTIAGTVAVRTRSEFESAGLRLRTGLCCCEIGGCGGCGQCQGGCGSLGGGGRPTAISRVDFITGYRYASLDESLQVTENLTSLVTADPGTFNISDSFDVDNEFHGVDLGFIYEWETRRWGVELTSKIALGNTRQRVRINGSTVISDGVSSFSDTGGLLALPSNIGSYSRDRFGVLPELSARLSYRITPRLRASVAYSLLYWANVARPGDQIDLDIDENGIPAAVAATARPQFAFHETALWAHGFNFGLDYNY